MEELRRVYRRMEYWERSQIIPGLEVRYNNPEMKRQIIEALILWKFIMEHLTEDVTWVERREFLAELVNSPNKYLAIVARLESLPTSIFQRLLWEYNIDFMSLESSLRRLSAEQYQNISDNYDDMFVRHDLPRVLGSFKCWVHMISVGELLEEPLAEEHRYERKAAMAYDFAYLNIGFNAYPGGVKDDASDFSKSGRKFMSIKKHQDDFVVKPNGRYAWLYRTARSNIAWNPGKKIVMNERVCPGWWFTIIMHFMFWIASPIALTALTAVFAAHGYQMSEVGIIKGVLLGAPAIIMPTWCLMAWFRFIVTSVITPLGDNETFEKYVSTPIGVVIIVALCCFAAYGVTFLGYKLIMAMAPIFTVPGSLIIVYMVVRFIAEQLDSLKYGNGLKSIREFSLDFKVTAPYFLIIMFEPFFERYGEAIAAWLLDLVLHRHVLALILCLLTVQIIFTFLAITVPASVEDERSQTYYLQLEKILFWVSSVSMFVVLGIVAWCGVLYGDYTAISFLVLVVALPVLAVLLGRRGIQIDQKTLQNTYGIKSFDLHTFVLNKWVRSLQQPMRGEVEEYLSFFIRNRVGHDERANAWSVIASKINLDVYKQLRKLDHIQHFLGYDALCLVVSGLNANEAWDQAAIMYDERQARQSIIAARRRKMKKYWSDLIGRRFKILVDFYKLQVEVFNKSCPFILESGQVSISGVFRKKQKTDTRRIINDFDGWD